MADEDIYGEPPSAADVAATVAVLGLALDRYVKNRARRTTVENAQDDPEKPMCRWVVEPDACDFCKSRGNFDFPPEKVPNESHSGCKCHPDTIFGRRIADGHFKDRHIDNEESIPSSEIRLLEFCKRDANGMRSVESCHALVKSMDSCMKEAFKEYQKTESAEAFDRYVNGLLGRIGNVYGIRITAQFAAKNSGRYCPCPKGEEIFAVCRIASIRKEAVFLSLSEVDGVLNVDLMVDGAYVDVKTPKGTAKLGKRFMHATRQCQEYGQEKGVVILSDLDFVGDFSGAESKGREFIASGTLERVIVVRMVEGTYEL